MQAEALTESRLQAAITGGGNAPVSAIIVAAGSASRMEGINKQQAMLLGKPVIVHTLLQFQRCDLISEIVLVCRESETASLSDLALKYDITKLKAAVSGGDTRNKSVANGVAACSDDTGYYCIHDGARPLITDEIIKETIAAAVQYGAAACGVPVKDTIKVVNEDEGILNTPERFMLRAVQTPQIFEKGLYLAALNHAESIHLSVTDDCGTVERYFADHKISRFVKMTAGSYTNIKITTPEDLLIAEALLKGAEQL